LGAEMVARGRAASSWDLSADSSLPVTDPHPHPRDGMRAPPTARVTCSRGPRTRRTTAACRR
ncbi:hypothetical protein AB0N50_35430, partial [Streptomyces pharetrae]